MLVSGKPLRQRWLPVLFIFLTSIAVVLPLVRLGPSCGHDFDFHLLSWIEVLHDWHLGLIYPHWLASANYGAGEPRFIFYPPLSWLLGAGLGGVGRLIAGPNAAWIAAPIIFTWVSILFAALAVYALICSLASRTSAAIVACLFMVNPYLLFVAYERAAFAELLATGFLALLLLLALRETLNIISMSIVVAALWLTNAPAAVMGCYLLAAVSLLRLVRERRIANAARAAVSCVLGIGLAGFYLVPAAFEQRWVQIERAVGEGMRVEDSFFFEHSGHLYHDKVLHTASIITTILAVIGIVAAWIAWRHSKGESQGKILTILLAGLLFLQFRFSDFAWRVLPRLKFLQFPWRWLVIVSIVAACLLAMALDRLGKRRLASLLTPLVIVGSIWACSHHFYNSCDADDSVPGQLSSFHDGSGVQGTDEYTARDADNSDVLQDIPPLRVMTSVDAELPEEGAGDNPEWISDWNFPTTVQARETIADWSAQHRRILLNAPKPGFAVLTLMDYPAWHVTLNGGSPTLEHRDDGLIAFAVPAGHSTIEVQWRNTRDIFWGRILSGIAAIALLLVFFFGRRTTVKFSESVRC
jgi:hypothetical protein